MGLGGRDLTLLSSLETPAPCLSCHIWSVSQVEKVVLFAI